MHRSRAPSIEPGTFVAQSWAGCITNMPGFNLRQAPPANPRTFAIERWLRCLSMHKRNSQWGEHWGPPPGEAVVRFRLAYQCLSIAMGRNESQPPNFGDSA
jgi:hypothetical protein